MPGRHSQHTRADAEAEGRRLLVRGRAAEAPLSGTATVPESLDDFLLEAQRMWASGLEQAAVVDYVYWSAARLGLTVRHDQHELHAAPETKADGGAGGAGAGASDNTAAGASDNAGDAEVVADDGADEAAAGAGEADEAAAGAGEAGAGADEAGAGAGEAGEAGETTAEAELVARKRATGRGARRRQKAARPVSVPCVRRRDGSHQLDIGRILGLSAAPGPRGAAPEAAEAKPARGATVGRLVLAGGRTGPGRRAGLAGPLRLACNGLVVDARTWRALAVPPRALTAAPPARTADAHLAAGLYDIIRVDDGTIVTLYCWDRPAAGPTWALASSNGYDVSSLRWSGDLTYAEIFHDLACRVYPQFAQETGIGLDAGSRLTFARLDRTRCYTVGFRHHAFHPLTADPERMWQIQCWEVAGPTPRPAPEGAGLPHVPHQTLCDSGRLAAAAAGIGAAAADAPLTCAALRALCRGALADAVEFVAGLPAAGAWEPTPRGVGPPPGLHYGYILRSRRPDLTGDCSDVLLESPLLARVRKLAYERPPAAVAAEVAPAERLEYCAVRAWLTATDRADFLALFPGWRPRLRAYEEFVENVVGQIVHTCRQRAMAPASREPALRSPTGQVARALLEHIRQFVSLSAFSPDTPKIIHDYVVTPEYAYLFMRALA